MDNETLHAQVVALSQALVTTPGVLLHCAHAKLLIQRFTHHNESLHYQIPHHTTSARGLVGEWRTIYTQPPDVGIPTPERVYKWFPGCLQQSDCLVLVELDEFSTTAIEALGEKLRNPDVVPNQHVTKYRLIDPTDQVEWNQRYWNRRPLFIIASPSHFQTDSSKKRLATFSRLLDLADYHVKE